MTRPRPEVAGTRLSAFAPIADPRTRLLILGSLPGAASLAAGRYYGHPRNAFWRLMSPVVGTDLTRLDYEERLEVLLEAGVGLWDVIASAERPGSLDADIRHAQPADLAGLIRALPALSAIGFNGGAASRLGRRLLAGSPLTLVDLPSSSPAHARPLAEKQAAWDVLRRHATRPCAHVSPPKT